MKDGEVDQPQFCKMIDLFIGEGFNYFDFYLMHAQCAGNFPKFKACRAVLKEDSCERAVGVPGGNFRAGKEFLESHGVRCTWDTLTERIINRDGTDICPMEKTVGELEDMEAGYAALKLRIKEMQNRA